MINIGDVFYLRFNDEFVDYVYSRSVVRLVIVVS